MHEQGGVAAPPHCVGVRVLASVAPRWGPVYNGYKNGFCWRLFSIQHLHSQEAPPSQLPSIRLTAMALSNANYREMVQEALKNLDQSGASFNDIKSYIFTNYHVKRGFANWVEHILKQMVEKGEVKKENTDYCLAKTSTPKKTTLAVCRVRRRRRRRRRRSRSKSRRRRRRRRSRSVRRRRRRRRRRSRSKSRRRRRGSRRRYKKRRGRRAFSKKGVLTRAAAQAIAKKSLKRHCQA